MAWLLALAGAAALANWAGPALQDAGGTLLYAVAALAGGIGFFWFTMWLLLAGRRSWRRLFPSALATGLCWLVMTVFFRLTLSHNITSGYAQYGAVGVVLALMTVLIAVGVVIILGALVGLLWEERHTVAARPAAAPDAAPRGP